ncbi:hypothetical protein HYV58_01080, partial [Candidatus Peregrinibacteria bacterium]|nr:hypothetical protein [Candidatus Peregrinibacteria bacterium]
FGWGRENYAVVFNRFFDTSFNEAGVAEGWEDRSHNVFLDETVQGGVLGLASYLALIISAYLFAKRYAAFIGLLIAFVVQNLTGVESLNSLLPFFFFLAHIHFLHSQSEKEPEAQALQPHRALPYARAATVLLGTYLVAATTYSFTVRPALGNYFIMKTVRAMVMDQPENFERYYPASLKNLRGSDMQKVELLTLVASSSYDSFGKRFVQNKSYAQVIEPVLRDLAESAKQFPYEERYLFALAHLQITRGGVEGKTVYLDEADRILAELIARMPERKLFQKGADKSKAVRNFITLNGQIPLQ